MSLKFSIIKNIETIVGNNIEDIIYEESEDWLLEKISYHTIKVLDRKKQSRFLTPRWTKKEILDALAASLDDTVKEFKKITIKIL